MKSLDGKAPYLNDRFMLGGPTCVRMFRLNSLGPKQKGTLYYGLTPVDSLGGTAFWAAGASLFAPIPTRPDWPLKLHAFTNMGQLMQVQPRKFVPLTSDAPVGLTSFHELLQPSASMGVGLLFQQGPVRLELNFGLPLCVRAGDGSRKGLQFGIGLEFL